MEKNSRLYNVLVRLKYQGFYELYTEKDNYRLLLSYQSQPKWNFLELERPTPAEYYDERFKTGNLNKINPEIRIYKRVD